MAVGKHPFPYRTRQLSPPAPMVLGGEPPGRVGRRRDSPAKAPAPAGAFARPEAVAHTGSIRPGLRQGVLWLIAGRRPVNDGRSEPRNPKKRPERAAGGPP